MMSCDKCSDVIIMISVCHMMSCDKCSDVIIMISVCHMMSLGISQEKILNQNKGGGYIDEASFIDFKKSVCWIKGKR